MSRVRRAIEKGETQGLMKITVDAETRKILGAAILGTGGDEAIHGIMNAGVPYSILQRAVPIHPDALRADPDAARRDAAHSIGPERRAAAICGRRGDAAYSTLRIGDLELRRMSNTRAQTRSPSPEGPLTRD
jgi:hypothetical protein